MESTSNMMPEVNFTTFIISLASSAMMHLGEVPHPDTKATAKDTVLAKHTIDLLNMLEDKFTNGLTDEEEKLFKDVLYEVRVRFVANNN